MLYLTNFLYDQIPALFSNFKSLFFNLAKNDRESNPSFTSLICFDFFVDFVFVVKVSIFFNNTNNVEDILLIQI